MDKLKQKRKIRFLILVVIISCAVLAVVGIMCYGKYRMGKIPELTFTEALSYTTKDNPDACITVGIVRDGQLSYKVYGENGIIWHNGGIGNYNCYLGFHPETQTAVVVLSNLAPNERIPATVLGIKLLTELTQ